MDHREVIACLRDTVFTPDTELHFKGGDVAPGFKLASNVKLHTVPDYAGYGYVYIGGKPALVDMGSRTVVWVQ